MFNDKDINEMMQEHLKSDEINQYVKDKIKSVLEKTIDDEFSSYSHNEDNGAYTTIREAMRDAIGLNLKELKLAEFQAMYIDSIQSSLKSVVTNDLHNMMHENMKALLITDSPVITLQDLIFSFLSSEDKINTYESYLSENDYDCERSFDHAGLAAEDIDLYDFQDSDEIIGTFFQKDSKYDFLEVCFDTKHNHEYSFQYDFHFRLKKVDKEEDLYECWSYSTKGIERDNINIVTTKLEDFERTAYHLVKGISKVKISKEELNSYFHDKD